MRHLIGVSEMGEFIFRGHDATLLGKTEVLVTSYLSFPQLCLGKCRSVLDVGGFRDKGNSSPWASYRLLSDRGFYFIEHFTALLVGLEVLSMSFSFFPSPFSCNRAI